MGSLGETNSSSVPFLSKPGVSDRTQAAVIALQHGLKMGGCAVSTSVPTMVYGEISVRLLSRIHCKEEPKWKRK